MFYANRPITLQALKDNIKLESETLRGNNSMLSNAEKSCVSRVREVKNMRAFGRRQKAVQKLVVNVNFFLFIFHKY